MFENDLNGVLSPLCWRVMTCSTHIRRINGRSRQSFRPAL